VRSKDDVEVAFREVISLDIDRVLSRLRSHRAESTRNIAGKRLLIDHLYDAVHGQSIKATKAIIESRHGVRDLQDLFARLESMIGLNAEILVVEGVVGEIVKQIHAFSLATNFAHSNSSKFSFQNLT